MKKVTKILILTFALIALFSVMAFADDPEKDGVFDYTPVSGYTVQFQKLGSGSRQDVSGTSASVEGKSTTFYPEADQFDITFPSESGKYYMIFVLEDETVPDVNNIVYLDQQTAKTDSLTLHAYPSALKNGKTYNIYVSSNDGSGYRQAGSFKYYQAYTLGDVDDDGVVGFLDAALVLQANAKLISLEPRQKLAANVTVDWLKDTDVDHDINSIDAMRILQYQAKLILSWTDEF